MGRFVHDRYYVNETHDDLWVTYGGKPLLITTDTLPDELVADFTLRKMWGLQGSLAEQEWSFLQDAPQNVAMTGDVAEQVSVCVAKQNDYMTNTATATPRNGGQTFQAQWQTAFDVHPRVVMLTWWNEWMAQRQADDAEGNVQFVDNYNSGEYILPHVSRIRSWMDQVFDVIAAEYSRDIEPQDPDQETTNGGKYLDWTQKYIAAYKNGESMPTDLID